ncbi:aromatic ring-hydroxylating dioxygenase subunit alpha [Oculatella sp. LEGE 06141]|uniref:aromatic ring-hydroxylating dioxygenase subunit alpha n=1 Tax=Oculatella sp. LEGE 06141 TaxID=1828648 RepID=UPI00187FAA0D|nr:aromatic ring-hydroxylating dioxygenase subunit alpha [Oculatella sp. LEGE 06141]MBE9181924.1 aromatic ring-hydroxylating dioxygenase subunit alpha [Oculatella sp. LEGE 06141]
MLKNFWYACEFSTLVTNQPKQIVMLNQRFVLYRNAQGQAIAMNDQCPHRGAALSAGWLENDCIRCPYHGWKFQENGQCIHIPANAANAPVPKKAYVESYPVQEKYGFIWLFYGDLPEAERPPIPPLPEFEDPTLHRFFLDFKVNTHYTRVLENSIDISHLPIVHANSFGAGFGDNPTVDDYTVEDEGWGMSATIVSKSSAKPKGLFKHFARQESADLVSKLTFYLPNITKVESSSKHIKIVNYAVHFPVNDTTTISKRILFRSFFPYAWSDRMFAKYYTKIYAEDSVVSESQYPGTVPYNLSAETHVASDALQVAYRKLRQKYLAMGWGLEPVHSSLPSSNGTIAPLSATALVN